ncbi:hypothetical protein [Larkinella sp. C7]|uniref:hypothetical protein n=1 Tax=Larkinella sp. C7 TaxID=2576607 RepID=UPI0011111D40|nr:hypothetical protein [Larkinella sp. C7]
MKNLFNHFFVLLFVFSLVGCGKEAEKEAEIDPDFTKGLTGKYAITSYTEGKTTLTFPQPGANGEMLVEKIDNTHVSIFPTITVGTVSLFEFDKVSVELKHESGNTFGIYNSGTKYGTISPTAVLISDTSLDGTFFELKGKR